MFSLHPSFLPPPPLSRRFPQTGNYIVQSVESCNDPGGCGQWIGSVANLWRTHGDIQATFESVLSNIKANDAMTPVAKPGNFNEWVEPSAAAQEGMVSRSLVAASHATLTTPL